MTRTWLAGTGACFFAALLSVPIWAQARAAVETYGTTAPIVENVSAWSFTSMNTTGVLTSLPDGGRHLASGLPFFAAPVNLPAGAMMDHIELDGCDSTFAADMLVRLYACAGGSCTVLYTAGSIGAEGCGRFPSPSQSYAVDNANSHYYIEARFGETTANVSLRSVRVFYRLRVSPAPLTATFADVPTTHPFHQFIEAVAAAGISAGCGNGNFCPNDPVTRGQLAVFLSRALGLHFAP